MKDRSLKKLISNRLIEREKPENNIRSLPIAPEKKIDIDRLGMMERNHSKQNNEVRNSSNKRSGSANSWASGRFNKIFNTLNQMKTNLNIHAVECD